MSMIDRIADDYDFLELDSMDHPMYSYYDMRTLFKDPEFMKLAHVPVLEFMRSYDEPPAIFDRFSKDICDKDINVDIIPSHDSMCVIGNVIGHGYYAEQIDVDKFRNECEADAEIYVEHEYKLKEDTTFFEAYCSIVYDMWSLSEYIGNIISGKLEEE